MAKSNKKRELEIRKLTVYQSINEAIQDIFDSDVTIEGRRPVSGGDINDAYRILLSNGEEAFLKLNANAKDNFFRAEVHGLAALREAGANVPKVLGYGNSSAGEKFLLLSYESSSCPLKDYWSILGQYLANMHRANTEKFTKDSTYGFYEDNFIGATPQKNKPQSKWIEFFRDERLGVQMKLADRYFDKEDRRLSRRLLDNLEEFLIEPEFPSLLHGDLWNGNVMPDSRGKPMFIDPAVYVGHHEADLAMTELFGGFSLRFYETYHEIIPKQPEYSNRRDIYNLYHLLNHLNLFGGSYLASVRRILKRYAPG